MAKQDSEDLEENLLPLERRICFLERIVMGPTPRVKLEPNLVDPLLDSITKLRNLTAGRERYNSLFKKMKELDPLEKIDQFHGSCDPDLVKWELILAQENKMRKIAVLTDSIVSLNKVIDSQVIKDLESFKPKLDKLKTIAINQKQKTLILSEETKGLIEEYNRILTKIKGRLVAWDKKISVLEAKKKDHKLKDLIPEFD